MVSCFPNQESWNPRRINRRSFSPRHANSVDRKLVQEEVGAEFLTSGGFNMIQPPTAQGDLSNYITSYIRWIPTFDSYLGYLRKSKHISTKHIPWYSPVLYRFAMPKTSDFPHFFMAQPDPDPIPSSGSPRLFRKGLTHGVHFKGNLVRPCCPAVPLKDGEQLWFILMVYHSTSMCHYDYLCIHNYIYARICLKNYFTSSYPHHDIYTFCYWQTFWHSIWHTFWHFIWHIFWHSIWHIFWHSSWHIFCNLFWHIFWHSIWHIFWNIFWHSIWHSIWQIFWHSIWQTFWHFIWHTYWHSIWHSIWHTFWHSTWHIFWHFIIFYLAYLLTFYLTYLLTFFLAYLLTFCLAYLLTFFLTFFLAFYLAYLLTFYLTSFLHFFPLRSGSAHCDLEVAVEVRQCPLGSGARRWGPGVPTGIWSSRLRSGSAHWDLELAVEVRQCPLGSGARGWGPAVPTATWKSRLRSGSAHCDLQLAVEVRQCPLGSGARGGGPAVPTGIWTARRRRRVRRRRRRRALLKSSNPHLAGGEIYIRACVCAHMNWPFFGYHSFQ